MSGPLTLHLKRMAGSLIEKLRLQRSIPYGDAFWYSGLNLWEPPVLIALP